jgi:YjbE family integral membrane protein
VSWLSSWFPGLDPQFVAAVLGIILIDLVLAGDNAVVIAMAVKNLPPQRRRQGILLGAGAAVVLRVIATFFVAQLLSIPLIKFVGGATVLWIGTKLFMEGAPGEARQAPATTLWQAVKLIVIADITLSIDNMLAVGGASHGDAALLFFGLVVSIPFVVLTSDVLSRLMNRFPVLIAVGAAVLGKVGAEMMATDPFVEGTHLLGPSALFVVEAVGAVGVLVVGRMLMRRSAAVAAGPAAEEPPAAVD